MKIVLFDIDGTIADNSHRLHYVEHEAFREDSHKSDWNSFLHPDNVKKDAPITHMIELGRKFYETGGYAIHLLTGRQESLRGITTAWLYRHGFTFYSNFHMRKDNDFRVDYEVKKEIITMNYNLSDIFIAIDDRQPVIDMMRQLGIPTLKV